jgi:hypothetical protein
MSPCIMTRIVNSVPWPGLIVIEPMTGVGGQQPSTTSTNGACVSRKGWSPELVSRYLTSTQLPSLTGPRSTQSRSTFSRGAPRISGAGVGRGHASHATAESNTGPAINAANSQPAILHGEVGDGRFRDELLLLIQLSITRFPAPIAEYFYQVRACAGDREGSNSVSRHDKAHYFLSRLVNYHWKYAGELRMVAKAFSAIRRSPVPH